jgi:hypothetical protein
MPSSHGYELQYRDFSRSVLRGTEIIPSEGITGTVNESLLGESVEL